MVDNLLILGAGSMQIPIIKKAKDLGYTTIVVDFDENAPGIKFADKFYNTSTLDKEGVLDIAKKENISGLLTTSDAPVRVVSFVGKKLGIPCMSEKVSEICTNKYLQRLLFSNNGINCPDFILCDPQTDISSLKKFPYIVKPIDSSASRGVTKVHNQDELTAAIKEAFSYSREGKIIVESFIEGREFSVETLSQDNKTHIVTITEKLTRGEQEGFFVEDTHIQPARISIEEKNLIEKEVIKAIEAIGINNCPTHTEIKINREGAFIIEIACRLGGDYITSDLVPLSTGIDMLENLIRLSVGKEIDTEKKFIAASAVQFLNPDNYNKCTNYISTHSKYIIRSEIEPFQNKVIKNSTDRLGYIIIQCPDIFKLEKELQIIL